MHYLLFATGLVLLLWGADRLVDGATGLARRLGVSALTTAVLVAGFGTSMPELLTSLDAALQGSPGLAIGNVVGSNTANVLLVLGVPALLAGLAASTSDSRDSYNVMLAGTVLFDGSDLLQWRSPNGAPAKWVLKDGYMESVRGSGYLFTAESFGDVSGEEVLDDWDVELFSRLDWAGWIDSQHAEALAISCDDE